MSLEKKSNYVFGKGKVINVIDYNNLNELEQLEVYKNWIKKQNKFEFVNINYLDIYLKFKV